MTVLNNSVAREVGLQMAGGRGTVVAGLSGRELIVGKGTIERIALGYPENRLPRPVSVALAPRLPDGVDGILDPSDAYSPLGFTIDLPGQLLSALDPETEGLKLQRQPVDGAVVPWLRDGYSRRPFVRLSDGRLALIDTGSDFGLAIAQPVRRSGERARVASDLGGGVIHATRVEPSNISIGSLELHGVPTDFLDGVEKGAPIILGRDALYPFKMRFDPIRKLIEIAPSRN
jgi:hypothetical protein